LNKNRFDFLALLGRVLLGHDRDACQVKYESLEEAES